jgi:hypothetical protein
MAGDVPTAAAVDISATSSGGLPPSPASVTVGQRPSTGFGGPILRVSGERGAGGWLRRPRDLWIDMGLPGVRGQDQRQAC